MRKHIIHIGVFLLFYTTCISAVYGHQAPVFERNGDAFYISQKGKAACVIVLSRSASETEIFAAAELKHYLDKITGATFGIQQSGSGKRPAIQLVVDSTLSAAAFSISSSPRAVTVSANSSSALLQATYYFLSRLGCVWLAPELNMYAGQGSFIPSHSDLSYKTGTINVKAPHFVYRVLDVDGGRSHNADNLLEMVKWMPKAGYNMLRVPVNLNNNGRVVWDNWRATLLPEIKKRGILLQVGGHGYQNFINAEMESGQLFKKHPDWFGKDSSCNCSPSERLVFNTTNKDAVSYFIVNILSYLKAHPEIDVFGLWPPDVGRWQDCAEWQKLGSPADRHALLSNQVDSAIKTIRKDLRLEIIAYSHVLAPPEKVTLNPDILVDICPIDQSFEFAINDPSSSNNGEYVNAIKSWRSRFPGEIGLYSYYRKYAWRSAPNIIPHYMQRDLQWYATVPLQGISTYAEPGDWFTYELNHFVLGNLAWNVHVNVDSLAAVFFTARYSGSTEVARDTYTLLEKVVRVYGSIPFTRLKSAGQIMEALKRIQIQKSSIGSALRVAAPAVRANLGRLALMVEYAEKDLLIQHALAKGTAVQEIHVMIRELVDFLSRNLDQGVFILTGQNDFARFTKKYGLTNQSLLD